MQTQQTTGGRAECNSTVGPSSWEDLIEILMLTLVVVFIVRGKLSYLLGGAAISLSITPSRLKLAGFCRSGIP